MVKQMLSMIRLITKGTYLCVRRWFGVPIRADAQVIAVFFNGKLGDMVCLTPLLRALAEARPESKIVVIGNAVNEQVLAGLPFVHEYIVHNAAARARVQLLNLSVGIVVAPNTEGLALFIDALVPTIICPKVVGGWSPYETRRYRLLRLFATHVVPHAFTGYAPREYLRLLEPLGIHATDTKKTLVCSAEAQEHAVLSCAAIHQPIIGILITAGNKIKEWPLEHFAELITTICMQHDVAVMLFGGPSDQSYADALQQLLPTDIRVRVHSRIAQLSVEQLKAHIARCALVIGVDTGPIYIAEAFEVPTIDIVGPVAEYTQPPISDRHVVVAPPYARVPQLHIMNARVYDVVEAIRQTESITAAHVYGAFQELYQRTGV